PLAGETVWTAAFFPRDEAEADAEESAAGKEKLRQLATVLGVTYEQLQAERSGLKEPLLWPSGSGKNPLELTPGQA
ncbi:hypothetical protein, partial [Paenibacillus sonchi]